MKVALIFDHFGPYHLARAEAASRVLDLTCIELHGKSRSYGWESASKGGLSITSLPETGANGADERRRLEPHLAAALREAEPDVVAINGWNDFMSMESLRWCLGHGVPAIVMSETTPWDERRVWHREFIKGRMVRMFSAGLAGGTPQKDYLAQLGLPESAVELGYDAVDNEFFTAKAAEWRSEGIRERGAKGQKDQGTKGPKDRGTEWWDAVEVGKLESWKVGKLEVGDRRSEGGDGGQNTDGPQDEGEKTGDRRRAYFLASARFIPKKNLGCLIEAYARYVQSWQCSVGSVQLGESRPELWDLVLLGDGPMKGELVQAALAAGLQVLEGAPWEAEGRKDQGTKGPKDKRQETGDGSQRTKGLKDEKSRGPRDQRTGGILWLPGFRQIDELPRFYAGAECFIHASTTEQWGLVVNEAMASGLPVLVSKRCGCAMDLVHPGVNGFTFDPENAVELSGLMVKVSDPGFDLGGFSAESRRIIADWGPERFAAGLKAAATTAVRRGAARVGMVNRLLLEILCRK